MSMSILMQVKAQSGRAHKPGMQIQTLREFFCTGIKGV